MVEKTRHTSVWLFSSLLASAVIDGKAQGTFDALIPITPITGGVLSAYPLGYVNNGIGWTFTPNQDLVVTAISSSASQVIFWQGTNQVLASYAYPSAHDTLQPVSALFLSANQNYAVSTRNTDGLSSTVFHFGSPNGTDNLPLISVSPYLTGFGSFQVSVDGQWTAYPADNANYIFIGPNFQFQVVPEPRSMTLLIFGLGFMSYAIKRKRR
ncbi:MAG: hypothetical protein NTZ16_08280 [Verrucomicrobia bacterium]|nr:hypothetical protein [Verrucomicrobiota bacterium]